MDASSLSVELEGKQGSDAAERHLTAEAQCLGASGEIGKDI